MENANEKNKIKRKMREKNALTKVNFKFYL